MEREFDISKINLKQPSLERKLTGEVLGSLSPDAPISPNAELEHGEYVKFPDNTVQRTEGQKHSKAGIKLNIPDGTQIISNYLKVSAKDAKVISEALDVKIKPGETYASVLDKHSKKIGLKKLNDEQEEVFEELRKVLEKKDKTGTQNINREFLSGKIKDIEDRKSEANMLLQKAFDLVFTIQESNKGVEPEGENFKFGGISGDRFQRLLDKHGLTKEQGLALMQRGGYYEEGGEKPFQDRLTPMEMAKLGSIARNELSEEEKSEFLEKLRGKYPDAGWSDYVNKIATEASSNPASPAGKIDAATREYTFSTRRAENPLYRSNVRDQRTGEQAFGQISDVDKALTNLYRQFPAQFNKSKLVTDNLVEIGEDGVVKAKEVEGKSYNRVLDEVTSLQENMDKQMRASANHLLKNKDSYNLTEGKVKELEDYLNNETFIESGKGKSTEERVREYDGKLGEFTSGRFSLGVDLVNPDELNTLKDKGIFSLSQIDEDTLKDLSPETQARIKKFKTDLPEDADFSLNIYKLPDAPVVVEEPKVDDIQDLGKLPSDRGPRMFYTPDQRTLPPTAMLPHLKVDTRLSRLDPLRVGIVPQLQQISDNRQFAADRLEDLPPSQKAAALASITASGMQAENQAIVNANQVNAQNLAQTELFNAGQRDRESLQNAQNALDYERRSYIARDVFDKNMRGWFDYNRRVELSEYDYNRRMNLASSIFPDYSPNFYGNRIDFDPDDENVSLEDRRAYLQAVGKSSAIS